MLLLAAEAAGRQRSYEIVVHLFTRRTLDSREMTSLHGKGRQTMSSMRGKVCLWKGYEQKNKEQLRLKQQ